MSEHEKIGKPTKRILVGADKPPERWISLLGFVIVTKADLLAAAAFFLSLVSLLYQTSLWFAKPSPTFFPPDLVYVYFDHYANNLTVARFASQASFVNTAAIGHDAIVRDIRIDVSAPHLSISEKWLSFVSIERDGTHLLVTPKEAAHPFPVTAGSSASQAVSFAPLEQMPCGQPTNTIQLCDRDADFVDESQFLNAAAKAKSLKVTFTIRFVGSRNPIQSSCDVPLGVGFLQYTAENGWFAARCVSEE